MLPIVSFTSGSILKANLKGQRLIAAFLLGCLLLNYPLLSLFQTEGHVFGIPLLFVYIFGAWLLLIVTVALVVEMPD
jgi:hypothetical protein